MTLRRWATTSMLLTCALIAAASFARNDASDLERKVDQLFAAYDKPDSPGCALGLIRDGSFIYKKGYGAASLELGQRGPRCGAGLPLAR